MRREGQRTDDATTGAHATDGVVARAAWVPPLLRRLGSVAQVTSKVDLMGNKDGGVWPKRRT